MKLNLNKFKESGLKCKTEKSFFGKTKRVHLGFRVTHNGDNLLDKNIINEEYDTTNL